MVEPAILVEPWESWVADPEGTLKQALVWIQQHGAAQAILREPTDVEFGQLLWTLRQVGDRVFRIPVCPPKGFETQGGFCVQRRDIIRDPIAERSMSPTSVPGVDTMLAGLAKAFPEHFRLISQEPDELLTQIPHKGWAKEFGFPRHWFMEPVAHNPVTGPQAMEAAAPWFW